MSDAAPFEFPQLFLVDGLLGFRISSGVITLSMGITRSGYPVEGPAVSQVIPAVDISMPLVILEQIIEVLQAKLAQGKAVAAMPIQGTVQ